MTTKEKYWLAGLLEGEGSFMSGPPSRPNCPIIACEMSDKDVIDRVADLFGVTYIYENVPDEETWSSTYKVNVKGTSAMKLMKELKPLMSERRQNQIQRALDSHTPNLSGEKRSTYGREQVVEAWEALQSGERPIDVAKRLAMKSQFVRDLNTGRTWSHVTGL